MSNLDLHYLPKLIVLKIEKKKYSWTIRTWASLFYAQIIKMCVCVCVCVCVHVCVCAQGVGGGVGGGVLGRFKDGVYL